MYRLDEDRLTPASRAALGRLKEVWAEPHPGIGPHPSVDRCVQDLFERYVSRVVRAMEDGCSADEARASFAESRARATMRERAMGAHDEAEEGLGMELMDLAIEAVSGVRLRVVRQFEAEEAGREAMLRKARESTINAMSRRVLGG